ncbi:ABC transporter ATP-binding protein [Flagellimonas algicola]|uniref:ABC transporter ATP-binding protein n=1 Tax=Flagellimonas algicola TaxID=2583815 RepID=A0ABY2WPH3_9FLAO|nr:ABC transporter ATP-binding protein [Allomuricauda algicola]TMU56896.1 ABC transporter ATP-binding protein [Allomuricauda algicola]
MSHPNRLNINVENLAIGYKDRVICQNIDLKLASGELCAIVGVNGVGKSTLVRTLGNLQPKMNGEIQIAGENLGAFNMDQLAKILSVVLTEQPASKNLRVQELIALGRQPYTNWIGTLTQEDKRYIQTNLKAFLLEDLKQRKCHELSDGQLQRVLIARAAAQDTPVVLLDEPTTHLDLYHKVQILKMLQQLAHQSKKTIVFTTHEIDLAIQLCDKILILDGKTNPFGTPSDLIKQKHFEQLFPSDMVQFDSSSGSFKVKK